MAEERPLFGSGNISEYHYTQIGELSNIFLEEFFGGRRKFSRFACRGLVWLKIVGKAARAPGARPANHRGAGFVNCYVGTGAEPPISVGRDGKAELGRAWNISNLPMPFHHPTQISADGRWLLCADGTPFFWLADTAWELFHRLGREEADFYLQTRARQGFTVVQAVVLAEENGLHAPNFYGDVPLRDDDPAQPVEAYFAHVDWIVARANELGLTLGMLPTWGDKWNLLWGQGPEIFTPENARAFGNWLGARYRDAAIAWILGGDRPIETEAHRAINDAMAAGLGETSRHLKTWHPNGRETSARWFHEASWLDFNMIQSGHGRDTPNGRNSPNFARVAADYARAPAKPVVDGEPGYEDHPAGFQMENGYLDSYDNRKSLYWALLSGAAGHTYGCHAVWQMWSAKHPPINHPRLPWRDSLELPGAAQMALARQILGDSWGALVPDQSLIVAQPEQEGAPLAHAHLVATRTLDRTRAWVYCPLDAPFELDQTQLSGDFWSANWHDPRNGERTRQGEWARGEARVWTPPGWGPDWVLEVRAF